VCRCAGFAELGTLPVASCVPGTNVSASGGFLVCDEWKYAHPPRVGEIIPRETGGGDPPPFKSCRVLEQTSYVAPQYMAAGDPLATVMVSKVAQHGGSEECCALCHANSTCKAWTMHGHKCSLTSDAAMAYPDNDRTSGYILSEDPATFCEQLFINSQGKPWADTHMAPGVDCVHLQPSHNASELGFPPAWNSAEPCPDNVCKRGIAYFFFPSASNKTCDCRASGYGDFTTTCNAPELVPSNATELFQGKKWIIYMHGGHFHDWDAIAANYAMLSSKVAKEANMGVLALDYRSTASIPQPTLFPGAIDDVTAAMQWLKRRGVSDIYMYGDSSGGTQAIQTVLYIEHLKAQGKDPQVSVSGIATFSSWLDLSDSNPMYATRQWCTGKCQGIGSPTYRSDAAADRLEGLCEAKRYVPANMSMLDGLISPMQARPELLSKLPPMLLIVGGAEVLLGETIQFAMKCQALGAPVQAEVWDGMVRAAASMQSSLSVYLSDVLCLRSGTTGSRSRRAAAPRACCRRAWRPSRGSASSCAPASAASSRAARRARAPASRRSSGTSRPTRCRRQARPTASASARRPRRSARPGERTDCDGRRDCSIAVFCFPHVCATPPSSRPRGGGSVWHHRVHEHEHVLVQY